MLSQFAKNMYDLLFHVFLSVRGK